jgi:hypothetical protein
MGPTKLVVPLTNDLPPQPFVVAANELLDQLYAETERLLLQKMTAVHYVARALIERDELIGDELEEVFLEAEAADPMLSRPFERKLIQFRSFMPRQAASPTPEWQPGAGEAGTAAAAVAGETPAADVDPWLLARAGEAAISEGDEMDAWTWAPRIGGPNAPRVGGPDWLLEDGYQE